MEGLEIKNILYSRLKIDNEKFRFDDEFFLKKYLHAYSIVKKNANIKFDSIIGVLTDFHANGSYENIAQVFSLLDKKDYAYMVRTSDLEKKDYNNDVKYISKECYEYLSKSKLFGEELLINKIGTPGKVYLMPKLGYPCTLGMNLFMVRLKEKCLFNTQFLWVYFNTEIGKNIIFRKINGTVPLTIDKEAIRSLYIPLFSVTFQNIIAGIVQDAEYKEEQATTIYHQAEDVLNKFINFKLPPINNNCHNIKTIAQSYRLSGRLDAEYYQSTYDLIIDRISQCPFGKDKIENLFIIKDEIFHPDHDTKYKYIELSDIGLNGSISDCTYEYGSNLPSRARRMVHKGDIIVPSVEGSLSSCAIIPAEYDGALCSTGFFVLSPQKINAETSLVLFKNRAIQLLLARACTGTILTAMNKDDFKAINVPLIKEDTQIEIADMIQQCGRLLLESKHLLNLAKSAIETAIEQGEEKAMTILE